MADDDRRPLAEQLARALNKIWKKAGKAIIPEGDVANGLERLMHSRKLRVDLLDKAADMDFRVALARSAIDAFQELAGMNIDGFLGPKTRAKLNQFRDCDQQNLPTEDVPSNSKAHGAFEEHQLLYYWMEPALMDYKIGDTTCGQIIEDAVANWTFKLKLVLRTPDPYNEDDANIHMKWDNLGGKGGTLGIANIGGRQRVNQVLLLRFDNSEDWNHDMFLNTATHELGHILGLTHSNEPGHIMSTFANKLTEPTPQDITRMQEIWGKGLLA